MFNDIEQLESEIVEFQRLVKDSSVILEQLGNNTKDIQKIKLDLDENIGNIHLIKQNLDMINNNMEERVTEIKALDRRLKGILALAILGISIGLGSIAMWLLV